MSANSLLEASPMIRRILIENVLEEDPETYDINTPLTQEQVDKIIGFLKAMEYTQSKTPRKFKRKKVSGQFSNRFKQIVNQNNHAKSCSDRKT